jgi:cupin superfamily acireductone dioxygenase involved in methionine salvage
MIIPLGKLNFELESIIDFLIDTNNYYWEDILKIFFSNLNSFPKSQEEYCHGGKPKCKFMKINGMRYREYKPKNKISLNPTLDKKIFKLIKSYCVSHEMQWGEVMFTVYGYLSIHRPDQKDCSLYYSI